MRFQEIQKMAKGVGIKTYRMKKAEMIRAIQDAENNIPCYGTERISNCGEVQCLWRNDCLAFNGHKVKR